MFVDIFPRDFENADKHKNISIVCPCHKNLNLGNDL